MKRILRHKLRLQSLGSESNIRVHRMHLKEVDYCCVLADVAHGIVKGLIPISAVEKKRLQPIAADLRHLAQLAHKHKSPQRFLQKHPQISVHLSKLLSRKWPA